jgi:preprotein translocase subunit SecD
VRAFAQIILGGVLALSAAQAQDSGKPAWGTSLLYQMDTAQVRTNWLQSLQRGARRALADESVAHKGVVIAENRILVNLRDARQIDVALARLKKLAAPLFDPLFNTSPGFDLTITAGVNGTITAGVNGVVVIEPTAPGLEDRIAKTLSRSIEVIRLRVDPNGTGDATVEPQGRDRILIQVAEPAAAEVKARVAITAKLTFQLVDISISPEQAQVEGVPPDDLLLSDTSNPARPVLVSKAVMLSGDDLVGAQALLDARTGGSAVAFEFNARGADTLVRVSRENIGKPLAIVLDDKVISAPVIRSEIPGGYGEITGHFSVEEANRLAVLLRSGALPAPLSLIEERTSVP